MSKNGSGIEPFHIAISQIVPHDASAAVNFEEQLDRHASIIARYGTEWADRLVEEADRLVEEAEAKRRAAVEFAEEIKQRASETAAELKAGFERIRAARCRRPAGNSTLGEFRNDPNDNYNVVSRVT